MDIKYVTDHTIFETVVGSRAYGTNRPDSDEDKAGVMIPGEEYFLGTDKVEQFQDFEDDHVVYEIRKAIVLISENNPNILDLLWTPDRCVLKTTKYWDKIRKNRDLFMSKRCRYTFAGYAISQLRRIRTHRRFLLGDHPEIIPIRSDFGLPEETLFPTIQLKSIMAAVLDLFPEDKKTSFVNELDRIYGDYIIPLFEANLNEDNRIVAMEWLQMGIKSQAKAIMAAGSTYIKDEYLEMAANELKYYTAMKEWSQYQEWKKNRNPARAEMEKKAGYDLKHAMHLVRLMRCGKEILETGRVNVDRTGIDADELKAILQGAWTFDHVEEYAEKMDAELGSLYEKSALPKHPNMPKIKELCVEVVSEYLKENEA